MDDISFAGKEIPGKKKVNTGEGSRKDNNQRGQGTSKEIKIRKRNSSLEDRKIIL